VSVSQPIPKAEAFAMTAVRAKPTAVGVAAFRTALHLLMCGGLGLGASACSMSFPISSFASDSDPTGSIDRPVTLLSKELDQEDWRRAKAAMAVALDPQGNGTSVAWNNPQSGAKGSFVAVAAPFSKNDKICRTFHADVVADAKADRKIEGSACRGSDGDWVVASAKEQSRSKA
jgi:surface antigen